jgi:preprotein translocase subunit SecE
VQIDKKVMKLKLYLEETYKELVYKVTWPSWTELQSSAIVVMIASIIIALIVFIMDKTFESVMELVYTMFF